jgi:Zn-dependent metalloprotease
MKHQNTLLSFAIAAALGVVASSASAAPGNGNGAVQRALAHLNGNGHNAAAVADGDQFFVRDVIVDANGAEHVRFDRSYKGLRVIGGDLVVHSNGNGAFMSASHTMRGALNLDTGARVTQEAAIATAQGAFSGVQSGNASAELVVYARDNNPRVAYEAIVKGVGFNQTPSEMHFLVDALSGAVIESFDAIETAASAGTGKTLYSGTIALTTDSQSSGGFALRDPSRGNTYTVSGKNGPTKGVIYTDADNAWGNFTNADAATAAADAQYGTAVTWDYYKNVHGRNGIANDGKGAYNSVHYGRNYVNAYWSDSCFCMTYGDGDGTTYGPLVNLDVAGHEMSHGVTSRSANLTYSGESGGLNEATSDIMGTMVEFYANNAGDAGDYLIGEKIYLNNPNGTKALRFMFKPSLDGGRSPDCYTSTIGSLDVHYSSGVANHFYYLLAEGATVPANFALTKSQLVCNGNTTLAGIGRDAASKIWYRALTTYMTSGTKYAGARTATLNAAADLYGGVGSATYKAVADAWSAVGVN